MFTFQLIQQLRKTVWKTSFRPWVLLKWGIEFPVLESNYHSFNTLIITLEVDGNLMHLVYFDSQQIRLGQAHWHVRVKSTITV